MEIEDLRALQLLTTFRDDDLSSNMRHIIAAIDESIHVAPFEHEGLMYTTVMFADHSVFSFHWKTNDDGTITGYECFLLFAYQTENEIPTCVTENSAVIGTMRYAIVADSPDTLQ